MTTLPRHRPPTHPGRMLLEEFLEPIGMTQVELANRIKVSYPRVNEIVNGKRGISPSFAIVLESALGTSAEMWVRMQAEYDLWEARQRVA